MACFAFIPTESSPFSRHSSVRRTVPAVLVFNFPPQLLHCPSPYHLAPPQKTVFPLRSIFQLVFFFPRNIFMLSSRKQGNNFPLPVSTASIIEQFWLRRQKNGVAALAAPTIMCAVTTECLQLSLCSRIGPIIVVRTLYFKPVG